MPEAILGKPMMVCTTAEFTEAWSEGDGPRILRCWKVMMLHFYANRNTKYALASLVHQLTCVNTHGPCDLHVNRHFKEIIVGTWVLILLRNQ